MAVTLNVIFVTGGREFFNGKQIHRDIEALSLLAPLERGLRRLRVAHGGHGLEQLDRGVPLDQVVSADALAWLATHRLDLIEGTCAVDHAVDGPWPEAGPRRSRRMIATLKPQFGLAYPVLGRANTGTWSCVRSAMAQGVPVAVYAPQCHVDVHKSRWRLLYSSDRWRSESAMFSCRVQDAQLFAESSEVPRSGRTSIEDHVLLVPNGSMGHDNALEILARLALASL
ncbi:hypothetical protein [Nannocystis pusilla]|uniref:hypothetical protein n=1 Tax=Nannocystis pusilla TaxID=889268 RepID=UPI003B7DCECE